MYKYLFFIILGIILFILLNSNDGFSIGVPEYLLTIDNTDINIVLSNYSHDEEAWAINEDGPLSPSNPVIMVDENRYYVYGDDSVDGINDANRNYATYVASMQSMAGGSTDSGGACSAINTKQKLMDSYKVCNSSITDDILSQLRCAFDSNEVGSYRTCDPKEIRCHMSMGIFQDPWLNEIYNITKLIFGPSDFTGWFEYGQYLNSGNHYLASLTTPIHSFVLEFKNKQFRILSSWESENSFLDFPSMSIWGNFDGHPDWDEFTRLMTILNGGPLLNPDGSKITTLPSNDSTWTWTEDQFRESGEIYNTLFSVPVDMQNLIDNKRDMEPGRRKHGDEYTGYPKGKVIEQLKVFIQINGLK
jgi:hypothetical protein